MAIPPANKDKKFLRLADRLSYVPTYIFAKLDAEKQELQKKNIDVIDLSLGSPDLPSPGVVIDECIKSLKDPTNYRYPPFRGQTKFKEAAADWMKRRFSIELNPESEILPLSGSKEGITHLALAMINPGDITIVPSPYYPVHARGTLLAGGQIHELPLLGKNKFLPELESIPKEILDKAKLFFISFPNNPTGAICDFTFLEKITRLCIKHEIVLVSDLAYSELTFDNFVASSILQVKGAKDIAVEFHTLSKTYSMAGWRIAFVAGNKDVINALYEIKTNTDYGVCNIVQSASVQAFSIPFSEHKKTARIYQERRDVMLQKLIKLGWNIPKPGGAMYIWLPVPKKYKTSFDFSHDLLHKAHVATIPGGSFGTYGEGYVRIALVDKKERLALAVDRMEKAGLVYQS
ncbi:MAG: aminotransferase class I/II-fold pyridoxal phosphate-dependent enzyme [Candidatus Melainabacteria bacterium]|nr:aminotransferase class I/II-fold pyridoxal phosphate-dependent enzyme [Candidatus Melainabacteria bacterium]